MAQAQEQKVVYMVIEHEQFQISNVHTFTSEAKADEKYVKIANSWYDKEFTSVDEVQDYQASEEWYDECFDSRLSITDSIVN